MDVPCKLNDVAVAEFNAQMDRITIAVGSFQTAIQQLADPLAMLKEAIPGLEQAAPLDALYLIPGRENQQTYWYRDLLRLVDWIRVAALNSERWSREIEQRIPMLLSHINAAQTPGGEALTAHNSEQLPAAWLAARQATQPPLSLSVWEEGNPNHRGGRLVCQAPQPRHTHPRGDRGRSAGEALPLMRHAGAPGRRCCLPYAQLSAHTRAAARRARRCRYGRRRPSQCSGWQPRWQLCHAWPRFVSRPRQVLGPRRQHWHRTGQPWRPGRPFWPRRQTWPLVVKSGVSMVYSPCGHLMAKIHIILDLRLIPCILATSLAQSWFVGSAVPKPTGHRCCTHAGCKCLQNGPTAVHTGTTSMNSPTRTRLTSCRSRVAQCACFRTSSPQRAPWQGSSPQMLVQHRHQRRQQRRPRF